MLSRLRHLDNKYRIRECFTPQWFTFSMSWGLVALLLRLLPVSIYLNHENLSSFLENTAKLIFFTDCFYISLFLSLLCSSKIAITNAFNKIPNMFFLGAILMNFATFISSLGVLFKIGLTSFVIWWIDVVLAFALFFYTFLEIVSHQKYRFKLPEEMNAALLLPALPMITASAAGAAITPWQTSGTLSAVTLLTSYILLGFGAFVAFIIIFFFFGKLLMSGRPKGQIAHTTWICLGPIGYVADTILKLARYADTVKWPTDKLNLFGETVTTSVFWIGLMLWGAGLCMFIFSWSFSVEAIYEAKKANTFKFGLGWWTIIFPFATLTFSTYELVNYTQYLFFYIISWTFCTLTCVLALCFHVTTIYRSIFKADEWWPVFWPKEEIDHDQVVLGNINVGNSLTTQRVGRSHEFEDHVRHSLDPNFEDYLRHAYPNDYSTITGTSVRVCKFDLRL